MNTILEIIETIKQQRNQALASAASEQELEKIRVEILGRKGIIADLMKDLASLSLEDKRTFGPLINQLKIETEKALKEKQELLVEQNIKNRTIAHKYFDVTAYRHTKLQGTMHIYTHIIQQLEDIFISMGYTVVDGPEIDNQQYNFEALNIPADHPARDEEDTFFISKSPLLLRTQTSSVQARVLESHTPPIAIFAPGRVYRKEATDQTHDFMFTQAEVVLVDKNISISHLLATARTFLQAIFEKKDLKIRVRPGFFPFVEPGLEIDASCFFCSSGCSVCKKTGWIELLGSGLVHPNVLRAANIDPITYSGFALGMGIERIAMIKYGINDIRLFHSSKIKFLDQFI